MAEPIVDKVALAMTWSDRAGQWAELAEAAANAGDQVTMIAALQRAAECIQIHRNLNPPQPNGGSDA